MKTDDYNSHPVASNGMAMYGAPGKRDYVFSTPGEASNHIRGEECEITFVYKRPWLKEADSPDDVKKVKIVVN